jgi:hypothetical protein
VVLGASAARMRHMFQTAPDEATLDQGLKVVFETNQPFFLAKKKDTPPNEGFQSISGELVMYTSKDIFFKAFEGKEDEIETHTMNGEQIKKAYEVNENQVKFMMVFDWLNEGKIGAVNIDRERYEKIMSSPDLKF